MCEWQNALCKGNLYELLTKHEVKIMMAGYWPCFFCLFMDRGQTSLIDDLLYGGFGEIVRDSTYSQGGNAARVPNHSAGFCSSHPLTELAI